MTRSAAGLDYAIRIERIVRIRSIMSNFVHYGERVGSNPDKQFKATLFQSGRLMLGPELPRARAVAARPHARRSGQVLLRRRGRRRVRRRRRDETRWAGHGRVGAGRRYARRHQHRHRAARAAGRYRAVPVNGCLVIGTWSVLCPNGPWSVRGPWSSVGIRHGPIRGPAVAESRMRRVRPRWPLLLRLPFVVIDRCRNR